VPKHENRRTRAVAGKNPLKKTFHLFSATKKVSTSELLKTRFRNEARNRNSISEFLQKTRIKISNAILVADFKCSNIVSRIFALAILPPTEFVSKNCIVRKKFEFLAFVSFLNF